ncbi:hypothetical protein CI109_100698 [Kwoniella shandongensis]|uniref:Uncharacterized protein n=1 Tax=Kwoniella shandongensis TaxID=1734106 RepID=A0A5M6BZE0_9TREE|nr:uncharacterized protein CI109_003381 [Kwoniella shandongensis]KAA5528093.1 hypothetical protein CI109_003381 [Kwoniella shandongensis]
MSNPTSDSAQPTTNDGFAVPPPPAKRQLRPAASLPTTAEIYGEKHGISPDLQAALQNVGRRGRLNVSQGHSTHRAFDRTQSFPSHVLGPSTTPNSNGFTTALDDFVHAQGVINKELHRARELQPFGNYVNAESTGAGSNRSVEDRLGLDGGAGKSRGRGKKLKFKPNGEVEEEEEEEDEDDRLDWGTAKQREQFHLVQSKKRRSSPAEPEEGGSDTETEIGEDDDEDDNTFDTTPTPGTTSTLSSNASEFPAVFKTPALTHPELFGPDAGPSNRALAGGRQMRGLPGAAGRKTVGWGKTMSAPVGSLSGGAGWGGMDVEMDKDEQEEDGFDVKEWAGSENF